MTTVSSQVLAERAGTTAAQVRKDLSLFGTFGTRGIGYAVPPLVNHLREILGLSRSWRVVLVGAGRIGSALFEYPTFRERGFHIISILDRDPGKIGRDWGGVRIQSVDEMEGVVQGTGVEIGLLAVPASEAQVVLDRLVGCGVRGVLNLAPVRLHAPEPVVVHDLDPTLELETLSFALRTRE